MSKFWKTILSAAIALSILFAIVLIAGDRMPPRFATDYRGNDAVDGINGSDEHGREFELKAAVQDAGSENDAAPQATIRFFDGETAQVRFRPMPAVGIPYPDSLASKLQEWKQAANEGDARIARLLFKSLDRCSRQIYRSDEELASAINRFQQTHIIDMKIAGKTVAVDMEPTADNVDMLRQHYNFCKGVAQSDIREADHWLEVAANNGSIRAQLTLGKKLLAQPEGRIFLEMAWRSGSVHAAALLAKSLAVENDQIKSDLVAAYAYQAIYAELIRAEYERRGLSEEPFGRSWIEADAAGLARIGNQLSPHQLRIAQQLTKKLFTANDRCCISS